MTAPTSASNGQDARAGERRILRRVLALTMPLALALFLVLPGIGPVLRVFSTPSTSMAPALAVGGYIVVSRASYGYSRHSFDWFSLPIRGRWPAISPKRGDIVAFRDPRNPSVVFVKRIVGLGGETVQMVGGRLVINGTPVERTRLQDVPDPSNSAGKPVPSYREHLPGASPYTIIEGLGDAGPFDSTRPIEIAAGHVFVLGDNRDNSVDSRMPTTGGGIGTVPVDLIIGPVVRVF